MSSPSPPSVPSSDSAPAIAARACKQTDLTRSSALEWVLRLTCALTLLGHAWVCWNGQLPIRALLWDEELMSGIVSSVFGIDWGTWVSSFEIGDRIDLAVRIQALVLLIFAVTALVPLRNRWLRGALVLTTANLAFVVCLKSLDAGVGLGHLAEHASQVAAPLILLLFLQNTHHPRWLLGLTKTALALTFFGHGLFAIGLTSGSIWLNHPLPGGFTEMTMLCLGFETELTANRLLLLGGVLDLLVALAIFAPGRPARIALQYMLIWGFFTALARPWAYFDAANAADSLNTWLPEALLRTPHFALPLYLLLALQTSGAENLAPETD
jgi:hypothetical protein